VAVSGSSQSPRAVQTQLAWNGLLTLQQHVAEWLTQLPFKETLIPLPSLVASKQFVPKCAESLMLSDP
jgi:hypothetical protein